MPRREEASSKPNTNTGQQLGEVESNLPDGWTKEWSRPKQRYYYFHGPSSQSQWDPPPMVAHSAGGHAELKTDPGEVESNLPDGWTKEWSRPKQRYYYFHGPTSQSRWDPPPLVAHSAGGHAELKTDPARWLEDQIVDKVAAGAAAVPSKNLIFMDDRNFICREISKYETYQELNSAIAFSQYLLPIGRLVTLIGELHQEAWNCDANPISIAEYVTEAVSQSSKKCVINENSIDFETSVKVMLEVCPGHEPSALGSAAIKETTKALRRAGLEKAIVLIDFRPELLTPPKHAKLYDSFWTVATKEKLLPSPEQMQMLGQQLGEEAEPLAMDAEFLKDLQGFIEPYFAVRHLFRLDSEEYDPVAFEYMTDQYIPALDARFQTLLEFLPLELRIADSADELYQSPIVPQRVITPDEVTKLLGFKNAYTCFMEAKSQEIKDANPEFTFEEVAKEVGELWEETPDKALFGQMAHEVNANDKEKIPVGPDAQYPELFQLLLKDLWKDVADFFILRELLRKDGPDEYIVIVGMMHHIKLKDTLECVGAKLLFNQEVDKRDDCIQLYGAYRI